MAGRCISAGRKMADLIRVIPPCFVTGHAAGVAAAVSLQDGCLVREVAKLQKILTEQDAYMGWGLRSCTSWQEICCWG